MKKFERNYKEFSMRILSKAILTMSSLAIAAVILCSATPVNTAPSNKPVVIKVVNFKSCVELSKMGKQEQAAFEGLKKQMETILADKEKTLTDISTKFNDPDYLDSLSPEAETELKRKYRALSQELSQIQNQYYQTLNQTNFKVVQKLTDAVTKASAQVAKDNGYDLVLTEESFYYSPELDITSKVVSVLDEMQEKETKEGVKPAASEASVS
jgi:outer membrane protein